MSTTRDPEPSGYHHGDLRAALLEATIDLVRESGVEAVTIRAVAKRAGVSVSAPYHHFASKAELLAGAAVPAFRALGASIDEAIRASDEDRDDPALAAAAGYVVFGLTHRGEYQLIFGRHVTELGLDTRSEVRAAGGATIEAATTAIQASLVRRGSPTTAENAFPLVRALLHGVVDLVHEQEFGAGIGLDDAVELARRGVDALLGGPLA